MPRVVEPSGVGLSPAYLMGKGLLPVKSMVAPFNGQRPGSSELLPVQALTCLAKLCIIGVGQWDHG